MGTIPPPPPGRFDDDAPIDEDDDEGPSVPVTGVVKLTDRRWRKGLQGNAAGKIKSLEHNIAQILRLHPEWVGVVAFDQFASKLVALKPPPFSAAAANTNDYPRAWRDVDTIATMQWLQSARGVLIDATRSATDNSLDAVGYANAFHPVRDYLAGLKWDATQRLPTLLSRYFGAEQSDYLAAVGTAWMVSAIARIMRPGCQADYMMVLEGSQGARKSSALRELFSDEWFTDARVTLNDEGLKKLQGKWCIELAELESFRGKAATEIKAFITSRVDNFRASYGRRPQDYPRSCVMAGTTNEREYLVDRTGNRRFWPVLCGTIDLAQLRHDRDQLWAEAVSRYESGEHWWLDDETVARAEQRKRELREPWFELIGDWLKSPSVPDPGSAGRRALNSAAGFTIADVMLGALNLRAADMQRDALTRVGFCMHKLNYERHWVTRDGLKERRYFPVGTRREER
jgi:putative DNA primase/helicase